MLNFAAYRPIFSLLRGTAFLLAASGLHGLLLPLRGQLEGFSTASLGLMGTAWAGGFVTGCYFAPRIVRRAGHVRAFGAFAASGAIVALLTGLLIDLIRLDRAARLHRLHHGRRLHGHRKLAQRNAPPTRTAAPSSAST